MTPADFYAKEEGLDLRMPEGRDAVKAETAHYQSAWCLVHVLMTSKTYADDVHHYFDLLRAGEPEALAWEKALDEDLEAIEADYNAALAPPEVMTLHTAYAPAKSQPERVRTMTDAEVHLLWARLRPWERPGAEAHVEADLAEAQRDPGDADLAMVEALWATHKGERGRADAILRQAVASNPEDPRLWSALGWSTLSEAERAHATANELVAKLLPIAAKLAPIAKSAAQLDFLAHVSLIDGKPDAALGYEKAAVAVDPNCVDCLAGAAAAMLEKGLGREALEVATLAQGISPEGANPPALARLIQQARALSKSGGVEAGCVRLRGPLANVDGLVAEIHRARQKGERVDATPEAYADVIAYLRSLPNAASSAAREGRASLLAYFERVVRELSEVPATSLPREEEDGLALLEKMPAACKMPPVKVVQIDTGLVQWDPQHPPDVLQQCWNAALGRDPRLVAAKVPMAVLIEQDGSVSFAHASGTPDADPTLVGCLEDGFLQMTYPHHEGGVANIVYPLRFQRRAATPKEPLQSAAK